MTLRSGAEQFQVPSDMTGGLQEVSDFDALAPRLYRSLASTLPENDMHETLDFASVLMKLVLILLVMLMAGSLVFAPDRTLAVAPAMFLLVAPLFVLVTLLDLAVGWRRSGAASRSPQRP
jgi:hypothetical protein